MLQYSVLNATHLNNNMHQIWYVSVVRTAMTFLYDMTYQVCAINSIYSTSPSQLPNPGILNILTEHLTTLNCSILGLYTSKQVSFQVKVTYRDVGGSNAEAFDTW